MTKRMRHETILKLVRKQPAVSQETLRIALGELGIVVTQATLSRDIYELRLVKTPDGYCLPAQLPVALTSDGDMRRVIRELMNEAIPAGNLVVVKTPPGAAGSLGIALDRSPIPDIVGTLAGDDVVLVVAKTAAIAVRLSKKLKELAD